MASQDQDLDFFGETFAEARAKFLLAAAATGGVVTSHSHPDAVGPDGRTLSIDAACFGAAGAPKTFIIISGTHGREGHADSGAQTAFTSAGALPALTAGRAGLLLLRS